VSASWSFSRSGIRPGEIRSAVALGPSLAKSAVTNRSNQIDIARRGAQDTALCVIIVVGTRLGLSEP
jgi:hypothetical protein